MLDILILGSPEVYWDGKPVVISRRIPRTMLYYLATFPRPVARASMLSVFWPEMDEHSARDAFRDNLGKLRSALPDPDLVQADNFTVGLDYSRVRVDYLRMQEISEELGRKPWLIPDEMPLPEDLCRGLVGIVELWRSPHFLTGIRLPDSLMLDEWLSQIEQSINHKRDRALDRLIRHYYTSNDYENCIRWLDAALEADQVNEELHLFKLETLAKAGRRSEAIKYGAYVQDLFFKEYHEQPSSLFVSALQRIKSEQEQVNQTRPQTEQLIRSSNLPFIGWADALKSLQAAWQNGLVVLVEGEVGIGKTRLVQEFYSRINPTPRLLVATCHPATEGIPFQPLIEMIRSGLTAEEISNLDSVDRSWLAQIDPLFKPTTLEKDSGSQLQVDDNQVFIHESIYRLCRLAASRQNILFFLEDAQSADEATINTFRIMAKNRFLGTRANLIVTMEKGATNPALQLLMNELSQQNRLRRIQLAPLASGAISQLVTSLTGRKESPTLLAQIEENYGGNPMMVIESLRGAALVNSSYGDIAPFQEVPGSIRAILRERFLNLGPVMQTLTSLTAIAGPFIQYDVLQRASQLSADEIVNALDALERNDILQSSEEKMNRGLIISFRQNIFKNVVLLEMSATRKRLLHRRLALAMEELADRGIEGHAAVLASHFEQAGDLEKAYRYWVKTGEYARRVSSPGDAFKAYRQAAMLIPMIESQLTDQDLQGFYDQWMDLAYLGHDPKTLRQIHNQVMDLGRRRNSSLLLGTGLTTLALEDFALNHFNEGLATIEQALRYFKEGGDLAQWLECMARKAKFLYMLSRFTQACGVIEQALGVVPDELNDRIRQAQALLHYDYATVLTLMGYTRQSVEEAEKSLQYFIQAHDLRSQAKVYGILVLANGYCGETVKAEMEGEVGLQLAEKSGYIRMQGYIHAYIAMVKVCRGKMDEAWEHIGKAHEIGERYGYNELLVIATRTRGDLFRYLGNSQKAVEYYQSAYEMASDSFYKVDSLSRLGYLNCFTGNVEAGLRMIGEAKTAADRMSLTSVSISCQIYSWVVQNSQAELKKIGSELQQVMNESLSRGLLAQWGTIMGLLARQDYFQGHPELAEEKIKTLIHRGREFEGLWAALLIQVLHDWTNPENDLLYEQWRLLIKEYVDNMEANCRNPVLRDSFVHFKSTIDKMVGL
jgi:DNA-binding SARP family transcriptional activator/predicted negative regulator of RcsB-dependent stress response